VVRFFVTLKPFPAYGLLVLAGVAAFGVVSVAWSPGELDSALGLVMFVQLFLVSTGFLVTAHRGHFDPVLGHGANRPAALAAHWCASICPGVTAWVILANTGLAVGSPAAVSAIAGTRAFAFFIASALAWSAGFALPRGGAGLAWTGVLLWLMLRHPDLLGWAGPDSSTTGLIRNTAAILVCPFLLLGGDVRIGAAPMLAAASAAVTMLLVTCRLGPRIDLYLVERS
jgi:hypothetical protein